LREAERVKGRSQFAGGEPQELLEKRTSRGGESVALEWIEGD
jgi:hypothetical protein